MPRVNATSSVERGFRFHPDADGQCLHGTSGRRCGQKPIRFARLLAALDFMQRPLEIAFA